MQYCHVPLQSDILSGNGRLEGVFDGGTPIRPSPPRDDVDAVQRIQRAMVSLGISAMQKSFDAGTDGKPDGVYGEETRLAVIKFQQRVFPKQPFEIDGRVGRNTLEKMDAALGSSPRPPRVIPSDRPTNRSFTFRQLSTPLVIKKSDDPLPPAPAAQDLEFQPVQRPGAERRARLLAPDLETFAKAALITVLRIGGVNPVELGNFFLSNRQPPPGFVRQLGKGDFWSKQVASDISFVANHLKLTAAIEAALQDLATANTSITVDLDVNQLREGASQPTPLQDFPTNISFSFKKDPLRVNGDPLAFGIGDIQGIEVRIADFSGNSDGSYQGNLSYDLLDHFGSNDTDVVDPGQASLWLLQRKMFPRQDKGAFMPYRLRITIDNVKFSGKLR